MTVLPIREHRQAASWIWIERRVWWLLGISIVCYAAIFSAAAIYKLHSFWMGFDLGTHEQMLWNTMHGRIAEVSPFGTTRSYLGIDIIVVELLLTPLYALAPHTETMLVVQVLLAASGALPLFLIARERSRSVWFGLLGALLYLSALPVQYAILYEFQIRTIGTVCLLWAFLFFERQRLWLFLLMGILAIWTRSDAGFALVAFGVYALIHRRRWPWVALPPIVGLGWLLLCVKVLIPAFRDDHGFLYGFLYDWLGGTPAEILRTLVLRPGYVAGQVLPGWKLLYVVELFAPLLFLPLLRPDILLLALPSLMLNLLSPDSIHSSIHYHYQAFVIPFLLIAALYALVDIQARAPRPALALAVLLVAAGLGAQIVLHSPLIGLATRPRDTQRIALAEQLIARIPPDASVSATSSFGPHVARRREIYNYPGVIAQNSPNAIYPPELATRGQYLLADLRELSEHPEQIAALRQLQIGGAWRTLVDQQEYLLLERIAP